MTEQQRPETGLMQFGEDWPGLYIRGKHAFYYAMCLRTALEKTDVTNVFSVGALKGLLSLLESTNVQNDPKPQLIKPFSEVVINGLEDEFLQLPDDESK
jgi:hypothetical protein